MESLPHHDRRIRGGAWSWNDQALPRRAGGALAASFAPLVGMAVRHQRSKVAIGLLFLNPAEERLQFLGLAERGEAVEPLVELFVGVGRVQLLVAGVAKGRAVVGLAAALLVLAV